jgi:hypothetical protein
MAQHALVVELKAVVLESGAFGTDENGPDAVLTGLSVI